MKIEWASHFRDDGSKRRPPPSAMHGWLAKMRGTLSGNEDLRSKGMREMRAATVRKHDERARPRHTSSSGHLFSFLGFGSKQKKREGSRLQSRRSAGGSTQRSRPAHHPSRSYHDTRAERPSGTTRRSTHPTGRYESSRPHHSRRNTRH